MKSLAMKPQAPVSLDEIKRVLAFSRRPDGEGLLAPKTQQSYDWMIARIERLEEAIIDACTSVGRQVVCDSACEDPYCILARGLGRNPVARR